MTFETYWLVVPLVGLGLSVFGWLALWLMRQSSFWAGFSTARGASSHSGVVAGRDIIGNFRPVRGKPKTADKQGSETPEEPAP
jgi:hypothetical protein